MPRLIITVCMCVVLLLGCNKSSSPMAQRSPDNEDHDLISSGASVAPAASAEPSNDQLDALGGEVSLDKITLTAPEGWNRKPASSDFILAEFALPRAADDTEDGRLTVSIAGGSVEANIDRWKTQFGGNPATESQETIDVEGLKVTVVDLTGEYKDQRGPFAPATERPAYRLRAAIIPVDDELHFIKAVGPQKTIAAHKDKLDVFVRSVRRK